MVKKKQRKAPAIVRSELAIKGREGVYYLKESYRLVRIRLLDIHDFIEITVKGGKKITFNKSQVASVMPFV